MSLLQRELMEEDVRVKEGEVVLVVIWTVLNDSKRRERSLDSND